EDRVGSPLGLVGGAALGLQTPTPLVGEQQLGAVVVERRRMPKREVRVGHRGEAPRVARVANGEQQTVRGGRAAPDSRRRASVPGIVAVNRPLARASAAALAAAAISSGASPCDSRAARSARIAGLLTTRACSGWARGTWITSMRNSSLFGSLSGVSPEHPASSL